MSYESVKASINADIRQQVLEDSISPVILADRMEDVLDFANENTSGGVTEEDLNAAIAGANAYTDSEVAALALMLQYGVRVKNPKQAPYNAMADGVMNLTTGKLTAGATDDSNALQECINDCTEFGWTMYVEDGIYRVSRTPWTTATPHDTIPRSQLYIPPQIFKSTEQMLSSKRSTFRMVGQSVPNACPAQYASVGTDYDDVFLPPTGVVIWSDYDNTSAVASMTTLLPSVIGTIGRDDMPRQFNYCGVMLKNIQVRTSTHSLTYATMNGVDMSHTKQLIADGLYIDTDLRPVYATAPAVNSIALLFPQVDGEMHNKASNVRVTGPYWAGVWGGEHMSGELTIMDCYFGYLQGGGHQAGYLNIVTTHNCRNQVYMVGSSWGIGLDVETVIKIGLLKVEVNSTAPTDFNYYKMVVDSGETLRGEIFYCIVQSGVGKNNALMSNIGASHINFINSTLYHVKGYVIDNFSGTVTPALVALTYPVNVSAGQSVEGFVIHYPLASGGGISLKKMDNANPGTWIVYSTPIFT